MALIARILTGLLTYGLGAVLIWLAAKGVILSDADQQWLKDAVPAAAMAVAGVLAVVVGVLWSRYIKPRWDRWTGKPAVLLIFLLPLVVGCGGAFQDSQNVQVLAMGQFRDEMIAFETKALEQIRKDKAQAIDLAWRWDLAEATKDGLVPLKVVQAKDVERKGLVAKGEADLKSLDSDFKLRIQLIDRAIALGGYSLEAMAQWTRAGKALQGIFIRAPDVAALASEAQKPPINPEPAVTPSLDAEPVPAVPANR